MKSPVGGHWETTLSPVTALAAPLYVATGVLIVAGLAKLRSPSATASSLRELRVPSPLTSARLLGAYEVALGVAAVVVGSPLLWGLVGLSYLGFTGFVLWALGDKSRVGSCGCFGREDTPATNGHLVFNAVAAAMALLAVINPVELSSFDGSAFEALLAVTLIAIGITLSITAMTVLPRTLQAASPQSVPAVAQFALTSSGPNSKERRT